MSPSPRQRVGQVPACRASRRGTNTATLPNHSQRHEPTIDAIDLRPTFAAGGSLPYFFSQR